MSRSALFDVLVEFRDFEIDSLITTRKLEDLKINSYTHEFALKSKFDITFYFTLSEEGINVILEYNSDIFDEVSIERMCKHLRNVLESVMLSPFLSIQKLPYLEEKEVLQLTTGFNSTGINYLSNLSVIELFETEAMLFPDKIALKYDGKEYTYKDVNEKSNKLANYLIEHYLITSNDLIAIMLDRSENVIISILGIIKSGAAYVPIDPLYPRSRKEYILSDTNAKVLITQSDYIFNLDYFQGNVFAIDIQLGSLITSESSPRIKQTWDDLCYIIYTSGSTGTPKGCEITHGNIYNYVQWANNYYFVSTPQSNFGFYTSLSFDLTVTSIFCCLTRGGTLTIYNQNEEISEIFKDSFSAKSGIDVIKLTPSHILLLKDSNIVSSTMLAAIVGGEAVNNEHVRILKTISPLIKIYNEYGPTEATVGCIVSELQLESPILIGRPISNTQIYIVDGSNNLQPINVIGEICIAGAGLARGYLNKADLTTTKFILNPFTENKRIYKTGDLGRWLADGTIEYFGRKDDQIKIRGHRIEVAEIESAMQSYPFMRSSVVIAKTNSLGQKVIVAYVVSETVLNNMELTSYLTEHLPAYMIPQYFVQLEELPLTHNGKINKKELPEPDALGINNGVMYVAPRNLIEETLAEVWSEVLAINKEIIGIRNNFFDLGGDSIKVIQMLSGLRRKLNLDLPISTVFKENTIEKIVNYFSDNNKGNLSDERLKEIDNVSMELELLKARILSSGTIEEENIEDIYPMSSIEKGMVFASLLTGEGTYHDQFVYEKTFFEFEINRFRSALELLVDKHSILRTKFNLSDYETEVQIVHKRIDFSIYQASIENLDRKEQETLISKYMEEELKRPFNISLSPLWRISIFNLGNHNIAIGFQFHHAILDGWSTTSFITELNNLYFELGKNYLYKPTLLKSTYKDLIVEYESYKKNKALADFWKKELSDYTRLDLFTKHSEYKRHVSHHNKKYLDKLKRAAVDLNTTVKTISLSAYLYTLHLLNYSTDLVIGMVTNTRPNCEDGDKILGCFLNTIPFRVTIETQISGVEFVTQIQNKFFELKPYEVLALQEIAQLHNEKSETGNPFFDVLFNYTDFHILNNIQSEAENKGADIKPVSGLLTGFERTNTYLNFNVNTTGNEYNIDISSIKRIKADVSLERVMQIYLRILDNIINEPSQLLSQQSYLNQYERQKLLVDFNRTEFNLPKESTFINLFLEQVNKNSNSIAILFNDISLTYNELNKKSNQLADFLQREFNVQSGDLIGIKQERSHWMIISMLAILKSGGAYVPIDMEYPQERIEYILSDANCKVLVDEDTLTRFKKNENTYSTNFISYIEKDNLAYIIYTSGSTGYPKGVMITHKNLNSFICWCKHEFASSLYDTVLAVTSICFDLSIFEIFYTLTTGKKIKVLKNALEIADNLNESECILLNTVPSVIGNLIKGNIDLSHITVLNMAGETIPNHYINYFDCEKIEIRNLYGPSEDTTYSTVYKIKTQDVILIGRPIFNTQVYILNEESNLLPIGAIGEICISGNGLSKGYLNKPELTLEKFVSHPFRKGEQMYKTGDLGRFLFDGNIEFLGRKDDQVKIRGFRIELGEITKILEQHVLIDTAIVISAEIGPEKELIAYITSKELISVSALRGYLKNSLPAYMIPTHYVQLEKLPLTANGKIDKKSLPSPFGKQINIGTEYIAPNTVTELGLADIWQEILSKTPIGINDDFFSSGGHSLKAMRLLVQIRKKFEVEIDLKDVFTNSTISTQAVLVEKASKFSFESIPLAKHAEGYPLSSSQHRLWILSHFEEANIAYNISGIYEFVGNLNYEALLYSLNSVIERYEILRTIFKEDENGELKQFVRSVDEMDFSANYEDLRNKKLNYKEINHLLRNSVMERFDLSSGPLIRVNLYQVEDKKWLFSYVTHHIISDGRSMEILVRELLVIYNSYVKQESLILTPLPMQYKDFAVWENERLKQKNIQISKEYWLNQLSGELPKLELLGDKRRPVVKTFNGGNVDRRIDLLRSSKLKQLGYENSCTLHMCLLTVLNILLYKYTSQEDIIIGNPVAGRNHSDLGNQIGFYVNTLAIRTRFKGKDSYYDILKNIRQTTLDAYAHDSYSFNELINDLHLERDMSRSPLFDVLIEFRDIELNSLLTSIHLDDLDIKLYDYPHEVSKFDLTFYFTELKDGINLRVEYNTDIYNKSRIEKLCSHFEELLESILASPASPINRLNYISKEELNELISFNGTTVDYSQGKNTILDLFEAQVLKQPNAIAVAFGDNSLSYEELNFKSNQLANQLRSISKDLTFEKLIGVMLDRSEKMIISILGILKCGFAYIPIDSRYPKSRKEYIMNDSHLKILITQTDYLFDLDYFKGEIFVVDIQLDTLTTSSLAPPISIDPGTLCYVIYTSGSTGLPKGCAVSHRNVFNYIQWANGYYFGELGKAEFGLYTSLSFDLTVTSIFCSLTTGGQLTVYGQYEEDAEILLKSFDSNNHLNAIKLTPSHINLIKNLEINSCDLSCVIVGGEAMKEEHVKILKEINPKIKIYNEYGPTETTVGCIVKELQVGDPILIGTPITNMQAYILDETQNIVPIGIAGEIYIEGAGVSQGYLNNSQLTAERFIIHPFKEDKRLYRTGDIGRWLENGNIEYIGRKDDQVKIRGYRIELGEIESVLQNHIQIQSAVALVREGHAGEKELVSYIVADSNLNVSELRDHLSRFLPDYMLPTSYIQIENLPLTQNGKIDKRSLLLIEGNAMKIGSTYKAPITALESKLTSIWERILNVERVGIDDNFFTIGGDSLKAIAMVISIRKELLMKLSVNTIYDFQTIAKLSAYLSSGGHFEYTDVQEQLKAGLKEIENIRQELEEEDRLVKKLPVVYEDIYPLTKVEEGMIYSSINYSEAPVYNDQFLYFLQIDDKSSFINAVHQLINRHAILRTKYFVKSFSRSVKVVLSSIVAPISFEDISNLLKEQQISLINTYLKEDLNTQDFDDAILWHIKLFQINVNDYCTVWSVHHAVLDGWSVSIFNNELSNLLSKDRKIILQPLKNTYKDYCAILLNRQMSLSVEAFWKKLLKDFTVNKLPFNYKNHVIREGKQMKKITKEFDKSLLVKLTELSSYHQLSLKSVCLSAHVFLMHILSVENDIVTGIVTHDRPEIEDSDKILGCFLNSIPIRIEMNLLTDFLSLLKKVNAFIQEVKSNEIHLSEISKIIKDKTHSGNPIFDTLFNFTDFYSYNEFENNASVRNLGSNFISKLDAPNEMTNTLLDLEVDKTLDLFTVRIKYVPSYFSDEEIQTAIDLYERILEHFTQDIHLPLSNFPLLSIDQKEVLISDFNSTVSPYSREKTIIELFEEQVQKGPQSLALSQNGFVMTYQELNEQSNQLSRYLIDKGLQKGDHVGLLVSRSFEMIIGMYGILKAGGSYVPVDPSYPVERQHYILTNSNVKQVVVEIIPDNDHFKMFEFICFDRSVLSKYSTANVSLTIDSTQLAYTIYTSGSTGTPKGVMIEHHSVVNLIEWVNNRFNVGKSDRLLFITSMCFDLSVYDIFGILSSGGTIVIATLEDVQNIDRLQFLLQHEKITFWDSVPSTMNYLIRELEVTNKTYIQNYLRLVFLSGDWIPVQLPERINDYFPKAKVISLGGATEGTVWSNYYPIEKVDSSWSSIPYGKPIQNNFFYILNDKLQPVPKGVAGELYIGGVGVARGYASNVDKTNFSFKQDPFHKDHGGIMYATGDIGKLMPDGNMEFLGRKDNQVKIRGYRVELGEIESTLLRHSHISDAIVSSYKDSNNNNELCAYVVLSDTLSKQEVKDYLKISLPSYMIPVHYIFLDLLPLTGNGKINRNGLPKPVGEESFKQLHLAARTELEIKLEQIWKNILNLESSISIQDDLFNLGANSLSVGAFINRVQKEIGLELNIREVFINPTIEGIAKILDLKTKVVFEKIQPIPDSSLGYVLSSSQRRLWILSQFKESSIAYNMTAAYELEGNLDFKALSSAFNILIERHEILRTVFQYDEEIGIRQFIKSIEESQFAINYEDLRKIPLNETKLKSILAKSFVEVFDLSQGPLLKTSIYQLGERKYIFSCVMHHIISDGWSMELLIKEVLSIYNSYVKGETVSLPVLQIQYKDYAFWQQKQLNLNGFKSHKSYWQKQFSGELPLLELAGDYIRPSIKTYNGGLVIKHFDTDLIEKLKTLSQTQGATLFMGLLAAVNVLLYKYTDQEDIIIGTPVAGRENLDLENQMGFYVNTLALRSKFNSEDSFNTLLLKVKETALNAYAHQAYPLDELIDDLDLHKDMSRNALFDVMIVLQNIEISDRLYEENIGNLEVRNFEDYEAIVSKFDLTFNFRELSQGLQCRLEYNSDIYNKETIEQLINHFGQLLQIVLVSSNQSIKDIEYLSHSEKHQLLIAFNETAFNYSQVETIVNLFEKQVKKTPLATAVVFENKSLTYLQLNERSNQLANYLQKNYKLTTEDLIGIELDKSELTIIAILAVLKTGAAYVPIDSEQPQIRKDFILSDSNCKAVINVDVLEQFQANQSLFSNENLLSVISSENLAYIIYTSGTTGTPKGVMIEHKSVINLISSQTNSFKIKAGENILQISNIAFDASVEQIFLALLNGACLSLVSRNTRLDVEKLEDFILSKSITHIHVVPSLLQYLTPKKYPSLKRIISGGDVCSKEIGNMWSEYCSFYNEYGPTETTVTSIQFLFSNKNSKMSKYLIGTPIGNTYVYILNNHKNLLPIGVIGELYIGGHGLARGYLNNDKLTKEKFVGNPFRENEKMYQTGDIGRWVSDGVIEFIGRRDDQIKIHGHRVELGEIENAIQNYPLVESCVVIAKTNVSGAKELVTYYKSKDILSVSDLRSHLSAHLPVYMIPSNYTKIREWPLTSNGKIDKVKLSLYENFGIKDHAIYTLPTTETEKKLVVMWSAILKVDAERIGTKDNFFELGGNSLHIIRLIMNIRKEFMLKMEIKDVFIQPTIANMAIEIDKLLWVKTSESLQSEDVDVERITF